jgi:predicted AAA+ superfamily ATPase
MLGAFEQRPDRGPLCENLVISEVAKVRPRGVDLHFWRTQAGAEVDLVMARGDRLLAAEIKAGSGERLHPSRGFASFQATYAPGVSCLLNRNSFPAPVLGQPLMLPVPAFLLGLEELLQQLG